MNHIQHEWPLASVRITIGNVEIRISVLFSVSPKSSFTIRSTAVKVGVLKLGNCLEMYTCPRQFPSMYTPPVYKEWPTRSSSVREVSKLVHMLCTNWALAWARVHFQAVSKLGHSNFYSSGDTFWLRCSIFTDTRLFSTPPFQFPYSVLKSVRC